MREGVREEGMTDVQESEAVMVACLVSLVGFGEAGLGHNLPGIHCLVIAVNQLVAVGEPTLRGREGT